MTVRVFILFLVGCTLLKGKNAFTVSVSYLKCFRDFESCGGYTWGTIVLVYLYDNLCEASMHYTKIVYGCLKLLQVNSIVAYFVDKLHY